jgi:hypothetical protein
MRRLIVGLATFSAIIILSCVPVCLATRSDEAWQAVDQAESELASAYVAVAEARDAGADISELVGRLYDAGSLLAEAGVFLRGGDLDGALANAVQCGVMLDGVSEAAFSLKSVAESYSREQLYLSAAVSSVSLISLFVISLFVWRALKRRYLKKLLALRPEVKAK